MYQNTAFDCLFSSEWLNISKGLSFTQFILAKKIALMCDQEIWEIKYTQT